MVTKVSSLVLGDSEVHINHLNQDVFGTSSGSVAEGNKQITISATGSLSGGGSLTVGAGGNLAITYTEPTNVSHFSNDVNYLVPGDSVGLLVNNLNYVSAGSNISVFNNDSGYAITGSNISLFANDAGYLTTFTETDPTVPAHVKSITAQQKTNWDTAYSWGNHSTQGYVTSDNYVISTSFNVLDGVLTLNRTGTLPSLTVDLDGRYQLAGTFSESDTLDTVTSRGNTTTNNITVNDITVSGNLTVNGTTTTINAAELHIEDNLIYLNEGSTITNPDLGWSGNYNDGTYAHAGMFRDATDGIFKAFDSYTPEPGQFIDTTHASFSLATIQAGGFIGNVTGTVSDISNHTTTNLAEGTNLYYTTARVDSRIDLYTGSNLDLSLKSTTNLAEGTNLYYTTARTNSAIDSRVTKAFVDSLGVNAASVDNDSVILGTSTTGNYAKAVAVMGNGLGMSGTPGEGTTFTITSNAVSTASINTIVFRDANANFSANVITATATTAQYADLAEKYTTEFDHPVGTVMMVPNSDEYETSPVVQGSIPIGVVSEKPAFLMNEKCDGQALALKGRVPVRVHGPIRKGEAVYVYDGGMASKQYNGACIVGVALETNIFEGEKLVECVLKL